MTRELASTVDDFAREIRRRNDALRYLLDGKQPPVLLQTGWWIEGNGPYMTDLDAVLAKVG